ncbi:MAG: penicillin-binding transpeptidase domain-containing protein [Planctomycetota bacterium]
MGRIRRVIPSMFHRRLALLGAMIVLGFMVLSGRLAWLTSVRGGSHRDQAESRLIRQSFLPTVRGRILDRKGRVLAQDRPSYDIAVSFDVISGSWAIQRSRRFAKRAHRDEWAMLDRDEREALAERYRPAYQARVERMWDLMALGAGVSRDEIDQARAGVLRRVNSVQADYTRRRAARERQKLVDAGIRIGEDEEAGIARVAASPVRETTQAHPLVRGVADDIGFRFMRLAEREQPMFLTSEVGDSALDERQPLFPGLAVIDTTSRVYPFDTLRVEIDRSTLPMPIRADGSVQIEVPDVAGLTLGRVRRGVFGPDPTRGDPGDSERRRIALEADATLRDRSLIPGVQVGDAMIDTGRYLTGDRVGRSGLESALEHELRGLRGVRVENLRTRAVRERAAIAGRDVRLTLDIHLQARVRAVLDPGVGLARVQAWHQNEDLPVGTELDAGAVVLDIGSGEILAMVSTPTPPRDGDWSARGLDQDALDLFLKVRSPYANRAIGVPYPPGSIAKALVLAGAADQGVYTPGERIEATGHYLPERTDVFRSWIYKQHGITHGDQLGRDPDGIDAMMVSSNVFFFTLGDRLGSRGIADVYRMFGLGEGFGLGIDGVWRGTIGPLDGSGNDGSTLSRDEAILLGIGQGPVTWTPLHAADAYATLARGGVRIAPTLISRAGSAPGVRRLGLPTDVVRDTLEGLLLAANDPRFGTGYDFAVGDDRDRVFNAPGVTVWGKTGTADASAIVIDGDGPDGPEPAVVVRDGDHSWYVTLASDAGGPPRYAIAVVVDYGGSGGRVSGPISNQIVHALIQEGYLGGEQASAEAIGASAGGRP